MAPLALSGSAHPNLMELEVIPNTVTLMGLVGTVNKTKRLIKTGDLPLVQATWLFCSSVIFGGCSRIVRKYRTTNNQERETNNRIGHPA